MRADIEGALRMFSQASEYVRMAGLQGEVERQRRSNLALFTETEFLREAAWVILCSGFREVVVRRVFDNISLCFCDWESASAIMEAYPACRIAAHSSFRNKAKLDAILNIARHVQHVGFFPLKRAVMRDPIRQLRQLPYIGPVTVWHLAKNLGLDAAKPDRHLVRISSALGFDNASALCGAIAKVTGEAVKVVDLIIWRYLADNRQQRAQFFIAMPPLQSGLDQR